MKKNKKDVVKIKQKNNTKNILVYGLVGLLIGLILGILLSSSFTTSGNATSIMSKNNTLLIDQIYTGNASECGLSPPNLEYCTGNVSCCNGGRPGCCARAGQKEIAQTN
jgi:hypothetical protein